MGCPEKLNACAFFPLSVSCVFISFSSSLQSLPLEHKHSHLDVQFDEWEDYFIAHGNETEISLPNLEVFD